jgi:hypothetical protein
MTRNEYVKDLKTRLDKLNTGITKIEHKAKKVKNEGKVKLQARIEYLQTRRDFALSKIQELNNTSEETWQDLKKGTENVINSLKAALTKTMSHFKKRKVT